MNVASRCMDEDSELTYEWSFQPYATASSSSVASTSECDSPVPVWVPHSGALPFTIGLALSSFVDKVGEYEAVLRGVDRAGNRKLVAFDERDKKRVNGCCVGWFDGGVVFRCMYH
jgi:hypothetical protein